MSLKNAIGLWFGLRGKSFTGYAFVLHRLTGIVLTIYLFLHLAFLTSLTQGEEAYTSLIRKTVTPTFLPFDIQLVGATIYHGLNGLRLVIAEFGLTRYHKELLWILGLIGLILWIYISYLLYKIVVV